MALINSADSHTIFDFNKESDIKGWRIVDDVVMGGKSSGSFKIDNDGFGVFEGNVSLENNGGFSSLRYRLKKIEVKKYTHLKISLKGDGKNYQIRIKDDLSNYYSYIIPITTSGEWEEIQIPLIDMYPAFRGRKLEQPNFSNDYIEEIAILIGNKKTEDFKLIIDKITLY